MKVISLPAKDDIATVLADFPISLSSIQRIVGGTYQPIFIPTPTDDRKITLFCNEDAKLLSLPPNLLLVEIHAEKHAEILDYILGDILIAATDKHGNTVGLLDTEITYIDSLFRTDNSFSVNGIPFSKFLILDKN